MDFDEGRARVFANANLALLDCDRLGDDPIVIAELLDDLQELNEFFLLRKQALVVSARPDGQGYTDEDRRSAVLDYERKRAGTVRRRARFAERLLVGGADHALIGEYLG